jgi:phosphate transport system substrate-binding protein
VEGKVGEGTSVQWPVGVGGKGNEGVAAYVKQIKGSIGYVELAYALQNKMPIRRCRTRPASSCSRAPTASSRGRQRRLASAKDFYLVITNAPGEHSWPITATTSC